MAECILCQTIGGKLIWQNNLLRVIDACDPAYPAFTRVIWQAHAAEMTDLGAQDQQTLMRIVLLVEQVQRDILQPDKINLAAFGNVVPHLHWHIIARWRDDAHFPQPVWAERPAASAAEQHAQENRRATTSAQIKNYHQALIAALERV
jgi:diadenosine tetraphosphate (Ap4A) HIT family hydrolase